MPALEIRVPGDKSIAHRALILGALAGGESRLEGVPAGQDVLATEACLRSLGVRIERTSGNAAIEGRGLGALQAPAGELDCLNSGTTMRLLSGVLAGSALKATLNGDASLRQRPMARVVEPLRAMGARIECADGRAPLRIEGARLRGARHLLTVASAQVKSALLLAGLHADGASSIKEPVQTRDHTERLMRAMGARLSTVEGVLQLEPQPAPLEPLRISIPGDFSSAAFWLGAAAIRPGWSVRVLGVGLNPTRTGFLSMLRAMGAEIRVDKQPDASTEPSGDVTVTGRSLGALQVDRSQVAAAIDEIPILMVVATQAEGVSSIEGAGELRLKESDRLRAMTDGLRLMGAKVEELAEGVRVTGPTRLRFADVEAAGDHRVAMALAVAGLLADRPPRISGAESAGVSYPGFFQQLELVAGA